VLSYPQEGTPYIITVGYTDKTISAILVPENWKGRKTTQFHIKSPTRSRIELLTKNMEQKK